MKNEFDYDERIMIYLYMFQSQYDCCYCVELVMGWVTFFSARCHKQLIQYLALTLIFMYEFNF